MPTIGLGRAAPVTFSLRTGEVIDVQGLTRQPMHAFLSLLCGRLQPSAGRYFVAGSDLAVMNAADRRAVLLRRVGASLAEQGFPGFEMTQWYGLLAPASLPQAHADKLAAVTACAIKEPAARSLLENDAAMAVGSTAAEFAKFIEVEQQRWKRVIARAKIKPD